MNLRKISIVILLVALASGSYLFYSSRKRDKSEMVPVANEVKISKTDIVSPEKRAEKFHKPPPSQVEEMVAASQSTNALAPDTSGNTISQTEVERDLEHIDELLGEENNKEALLLCKKWMKSADPEVRDDIAFSLGWMGVRALPELSRMLSDENKEVRDTAFSSWSDALDDLKEEDLKVEMIVLGISVINDKDNIDAAVMQLETVSDNNAVNAMIRIIQDGVPVASEAAREHYSFVTGEDYTTPQAARQWLEDNAE